MKFITVQNGIILPFISDAKGGVCDMDMNFIPQSKHDGGWLKLGGPYEIGGGAANQK